MAPCAGHAHAVPRPPAPAPHGQSAAGTLAGQGTRGWAAQGARAPAHRQHARARRPRTLNRLELVGETLRAALNAIAAGAPDPLGRITPREWHERYVRRAENICLPEAAAKRGLRRSGQCGRLPAPERARRTRHACGTARGRHAAARTGATLRTDHARHRRQGKRQHPRRSSFATCGRATQTSAWRHPRITTFGSAAGVGPAT